jgi:hypothetical protein
MTMTMTMTRRALPLLIGAATLLLPAGVRAGLAPATPTGFTVTRAYPTAAKLWWNVVPNATSYIIYKSTDFYGPYIPDGTFTAPGGTMAFQRGTTYWLSIAAANADGTSSPSSPIPFYLPVLDPRFDYDGDIKCDLTVWRPANGTWYTLKSKSGFDPAQAQGLQWGSQAQNDVPIGGDLDGDGISDLIIWRPGNGTWYWRLSSYFYVPTGWKQWGTAGDTPLLGDIDGDYYSDLIIWRPSTATWYWLTSSSGYSYAAQGQKVFGGVPGDVPLIGDFDGDFKADLAIWRGQTGTFFWLTSSSGYNPFLVGSKQWGSGAQGDIPFLADLDGDHLSDLIVWRPGSGMWYWLPSSHGYGYLWQAQRQWGSGAQNDVPMVADMDGDEKGDLVIWRPSSGTWFWLRSVWSWDYPHQQQRQWGASGDIPANK